MERLIVPHMLTKSATGDKVMKYDRVWVVIYLNAEELKAIGVEAATGSDTNKNKDVRPENAYSGERKKQTIRRKKPE